MSGIVLQIRGTQVSEEGESNVEITTHGTLRKGESGYVLSYEESDDEENVHTDIYIQGDTVIMNKTGSMETQFVFEQSKLCSTEYKTPLGALYVTLFPTMVETRIGDEKGRIEIEYILNVAGAQIVNRLNLRYGQHHTPAC